MPWRPELLVEEIPAPQRIAPHALAISAEVNVRDDEWGSGRLILLHDPLGNPAWDGTFRCVTYARAEVDADMGADPMLAEVGWSWLVDALDRHHADYTEPSGSVTAVTTRCFGTMESDPPRDEVEIRASWTSQLNSGADLIAHLSGWQDVLCHVSGLPPLPPGVVSLNARQALKRL